VQPQSADAHTNGKRVVMAVKKRVVYYLSGFDPRGVRWYHSLYKEHAAKQSQINGMVISVGPRKKLHNHLFEWKIESTDHDCKVETDYRFMSWDDIIRQEWSSEIMTYYKDVIYCIVAYIFTGLVWSFAKASPKQMMAAFYPVIYLLGGLAAALYGAMIVFDIVGGWIGAASGIAVALTILVAMERFGNHIGVFWLLRIYVFSVRWGRGEVDAIEKRLDHFANEISKSLLEENEADEVLLISHSVGTILSVSALARALKKSETGWEKFSMITLGECIPLLSFQPKAIHYRSELASIALNSKILWIDYTSPIDGACFPLHNYIKSSEISNIAVNFQLKSTRFHTLFDKIKYKQLRKDWYATHFLYLMSTQKEGSYDFYKFTAGSQEFRKYFTKES
jgi:hypothetical protein